MWHHPNYYKKLRANRQQATGLEPSGNGREGHEPSSGGREGPQVSSAKLKNKIVDSSSQVGYSGITTAAIHSGHSSARPVQLKAQSDTGDAPLKGPPNGAAEALQVDQHKYPGDGSSRTCSVMVKSKPRVLSSQANKQQAEGNGRVGPKDSSGQASSGSRINKR